MAKQTWTSIVIGDNRGDSNCEQEVEIGDLMCSRVQQFLVSLSTTIEMTYNQGLFPYNPRALLARISRVIEQTDVAGFVH